MTTARTEATRPDARTADGGDAGASRRAAAAVVADVARRLADPAAVVRAARHEDNLDRPPGGAPAHPWSGLTLAEGHPGIALLFAELSRQDSAHRRIAHAHLAAGAPMVGPLPRSGLYAGPPSLAFAARAARHGPDDYGTLLETLDSHVLTRVRELVARETERLDAGRAGAGMDTYDLILGLTGLGRYLLTCGEEHRDELTGALTCLVRLTEPVVVRGHTVPGWWVPGPPGLGQEAHFPDGHFNLGLAHGICGPLALLALAHEAGVTVSGQRDAVTGIATWLLERRADDHRWPAAIGFDDEVAGARGERPDGRTAWCYGTPGVARALFLAGRALGRPDWRRIAVDSLVRALDAPSSFADCGLCHGWAGILHIVGRMAQDTADPRLTGRLPRLAERIIAAHDPALPFGYRYADTPPGLWARDRAGFLEGAAGIALALHTYATGTAPSTDWDAAVLLA